MSLLLTALTLVQIGSSWDIQLSEPYVLDRPVSMLILYPGNHDPSEISKLKQNETRVLCYVSIGTVEDWLDDAGDFPAKAIGKALPYGDSEHYVDYRRQDDLVPIMERRFQACKTAGFNGIYPDNLDAFQNDSGFKLSADDALSYVTALADVAHGLGLVMAQVNAPDLADDLAAKLDVAIASSCWTD